MPTAKELGARIEAARLAQRMSVKAAAKAAGIARDTWVKVEAGGSVHDTKRQAALDLLGLDSDGHPHVGGATQTAGQFVGGTGERVDEGRREDSQVLQAITAMSATLDQLLAGQRGQSSELRSLAEDSRDTRARLATVEDAQRDLSRRLEKLEESRP